MCITFLSIGYHEGYKLVLVCNRDEDIFRPTLNANWWENEAILGAKDLEKNGSQFAVSRDGKIAIITNYREIDHKVYESSRGHIVVDYLRGSKSPEEFLKNLSDNKNNYPGFNVILGTIDNLWYYGNRDLNPPRKLQSQMVYGLSNALLDSNWPKVMKGKDMLSKIKDPSNIDDLLQILKNKHDVRDNDVQCTDFGLEEERKAASIFHHPVGNFKMYNNFGTRAHYIFTVDNDNCANFIEYSYNKDSDSWDKAEYSFRIQT